MISARNAARDNFRSAVSVGYISLFIVACAPVFGQTIATRNLPAQQWTEAYRQLNRQIYRRPDDPESGSRKGSDSMMRSTSKQLDSMIKGEIEAALSAPKSSADSITASISALQDGYSLSAWDHAVTNTPFARLFSLNGVQTAAIAYVIMQGGDAAPDTQPHLLFYDNALGNWVQKASAPTLRDFEGYTFSVEQLNSGLPGEIWLIAWGAPFGSSHASIRLRLYLFDGHSVRTTWKRENLDAGKVSVAGDALTIDYLDTKDPSIERREVYHVSSGALLPE